MIFEYLLRALKSLAQGQFRRVWNEAHVRIYRFLRYNFLHPSFLLYRKKVTA